MRAGARLPRRALPGFCYHFLNQAVIGGSKEKNGITSYAHLRADKITFVAFGRILLYLRVLQSVYPLLNETRDLLGIGNVYAFKGVYLKAAVVKGNTNGVTPDPRKAGRFLPFSDVKSTERFSVRNGKAVFLGIGIKNTRTAFFAKVFGELYNEGVYVFGTFFARAKAKSTNQSG